LSDLLSELIQTDKIGIITITFLAGLTGSIHCIGMCGAFASTCASKTSALGFYHIGRLISYSLLGLLGGLLGSLFIQLIENPIFQLIPSVVLGLGFIIFGIRTLKTKQLKLSSPHFLQKKINNLYVLFFKTENLSLRSFLLGISSSLLPCGLLYGVLIALVTFQNPITGVIGMASFCVGTMPALFVAPSAIAKIINPLKAKWPQFIAMTTTSVGVFIITYRLVNAYEEIICH
jgi:sulfite exporter TauE/SafE